MKLKASVLLVAFVLSFVATGGVGARIQSPSNTRPIRVDVLPGSLRRYSGGGISIMQQMVIDVTGKPFPQFMQKEVLDRLAMKHSTYEQPLPKRMCYSLLSKTKKGKSRSC